MTEPTRTDSAFERPVRDRLLLVLWIALKIAILAQLAAPARDFAYQGF